MNSRYLLCYHAFCAYLFIDLYTIGDILWLVFHTSMDWITRSCWKHLAFGFTSYDLPELYFIELHGGYVLSFVILPVDFYHSSWRISLCNIDSIPWLNIWLARASFRVLNCMSMFEYCGITLARIWYTHWHSYINCMIGFRRICNTLAFVLASYLAYSILVS